MLSEETVNASNMSIWLDMFSERPAGCWQYTNVTWGFCYLGYLLFGNPVGCLAH